MSVFECVNALTALRRHRQSLLETRAQRKRDLAHHRSLASSLEIAILDCELALRDTEAAIAALEAGRS